MVESSNVTFFGNNHQQILVGSTITLRCIENYEFESSSNKTYIIQCQNDGSWTSMPSCRRKQLFQCIRSILQKDFLFFLPYRSSTNV